MVPQDVQNVFEKILQPVSPFIDYTQKQFGDKDKYKLNFTNFTTILLYCIISRIKSINQLIVDIETSKTAQVLKLINVSKSMYSEAFNRYKPELYRMIFGKLLASYNFLEIPEISTLGKMLLIDGSTFPAIAKMQWASYKEKSNAIKLHLAFELNRMIPVNFLCTEGNYSEKKFLLDILEKGITYICDRGYISFELFKDICVKNAFFIIRGKENMKFSVIESIEIAIPITFHNFFDKISDSFICFENDKSNILYRIVQFTVNKEVYILITNRMDLTTYEVIMLYAYRWQVELCFKYIKRTLKGIHLLCQSPNGIQVQFYLYMISYLLLIIFKQENASIVDDVISEKDKKDNSLIKENKKPQVRNYVCGLVTLLGEKLNKLLKCSLYWLIAVKNSLLEPYNKQTVMKISKYA